MRTLKNWLASIKAPTRPDVRYFEAISAAWRIASAPVRQW